MISLSQTGFNLFTFSRHFKSKNFRKIYLLLLLLSFSEPAFSQFDKEGITWYYNLRDESDTTGKTFYGHKITTGTDTLIQGKSCRKIENLAQWLPRGSNVVLPKYVFLHEDMNKYYLYDFNLDSFTLWYQHGLVLGDTFVFNWNNRSDSFVVDRLYNTPPGFSSTYYEQIENRTGTNRYYRFIYPLGYEFNFIPTPSDLNTDPWNMDSLTFLRCFDDGQGKKLHNYGGECDDTVTLFIKKKSNFPELNLYPNPVSGQILHIDLPPDIQEKFLVNLFTVAGKKVWSGENEREIDFASLPLHQFYILELVFEDGTFIYRKILN